VQQMTQAVTREFAIQIKENIETETYVSSTLLLRHHQMNPFDVVFLDIDMPEPDGFTVAKEISDSHECFIIFVTNHSELVYDSFMFKPLNFIYKGTEEYMAARIREVVKQISEQIKQDKDIVINNRDEKRFSVPVKSIVYIESSKHYLVLNTIDDKSIKTRGSISEAEEEYSQYDFVRIHRKYIANLKYVLNIDRSGKTVIFKQHFELPLGDIYKENVDARLTEYVRRIK
jgi:DNA-binding LytR/AlgR family response regulator